MIIFIFLEIIIIIIIMADKVLLSLCLTRGRKKPSGEQIGFNNFNVNNDEFGLRKPTQSQNNTIGAAQPIKRGSTHRP